MKRIGFVKDIREAIEGVPDDWEVFTEVNVDECDIGKSITKIGRKFKCDKFIIIEIADTKEDR